MRTAFGGRADHIRCEVGIDAAGGPGDNMKLTKIDAAEAQIRAAVRMFFERGHPVPVYTLANAAREIVATIGDQIDVETVQQELAAARGLTVKELLRPLSQTANFFKHADRDADAVLDFDEGDAEVALQLACHDFGRITGGMPTEAQIYEAWVAAIAFPKVSEAPLRGQRLIRGIIRWFPGIRRAADRAEQKKIGLAVLERALANPMLQMKFKREVQLPSSPRVPRENS
jgi:hypothetical protein